MRAALIQLNAGDQPLKNLPVTERFIREAVSRGAGFVLTPEVTNIVSTSTRHQQDILWFEDSDPTLERLRHLADELKIWLLVGSLALKTRYGDGRLVNRSLLIAPDGSIRARYDKIHMFDVEISAAETWRESEGFLPGERAVLADTSFARVGMTICYDLRFAHLHRALAQAGADILSVPAAFSPVSGAAHWHVLLRARAIETGCYVLAPAQCGDHAIPRGRPRSTYGHSLAVDPWGKVLADGGTEPGVILVDLDRSEVARARARIPSLKHDRPYSGPS
ncbi:MAG: carbon-nitrogen hydrolase family protein [Paracoccaceae bacterium]